MNATPKDEGATLIAESDHERVAKVLSDVAARRPSIIIVMASDADGNAFIDAAGPILHLVTLHRHLTPVLQKLINERAAAIGGAPKKEDGNALH